MLLTRSISTLAITPLLFAALLAKGSAPFQPTSRRILIPPHTCPVTQPPSKPFTPPAPYPSELPSDRFWLGSEKLWTSPSKNGLWFGYWTTDRELGKYKVYFDKMFWWRKGWRTENPPQLKVSGRRLDPPAAPFYADHAKTANIINPAMVTGIDIPTVGCWEITGDYKGDKLSFVVWVVDPPSDSP